MENLGTSFLLDFVIITFWPTLQNYFTRPLQFICRYLFMQVPPTAFQSGWVLDLHSFLVFFQSLCYRFAVLLEIIFSFVWHSLSLTFKLRILWCTVIDSLVESMTARCPGLVAAKQTQIIPTTMFDGWYEVFVLKISTLVSSFQSTDL